MTNLLAPAIPHQAVWVLYEGTDRQHCAVCGRTESMHPAYLDQDTDLGDEAEQV